MGTNPRIALFDIETSPNLSFVWGHYQQDVIENDQPWHILCFAYKWLGEKKIHTKALCDYRGYKKDKDSDKALCADLWKLFDEADILIGHNGDRFDIKKVRARLIIHGFDPPSPFKSIDTVKIARKEFRFDSNRLNDLGKYLGLGKKLPHTGFHLWRSCMSGDDKSWKLMKKYNARDVELLEDVYEKLKPWASSHPNLNVYSEALACPTCQSANIQKRGVAVSKSKKYQRLQCQDCGAWAKGKPIKQ